MPKVPSFVVKTRPSQINSPTFSTWMVQISDKKQQCLCAWVLLAILASVLNAMWQKIFWLGGHTTDDMVSCAGKSRPAYAAYDQPSLPPAKCHSYSGDDRSSQWAQLTSCAPASTTSQLLLIGSHSLCFGFGLPGRLLLGWILRWRGASREDLKVMSYFFLFLCSFQGYQSGHLKGSPKKGTQQKILLG